MTTNPALHEVNEHLSNWAAPPPAAGRLALVAARPGGGLAAGPGAVAGGAADAVPARAGADRPVAGAGAGRVWPGRGAGLFLAAPAPGAGPLLRPAVWPGRAHLRRAGTGRPAAGTPGLARARPVGRCRRRRAPGGPAPEAALSVQPPRWPRAAWRGAGPGAPRSTCRTRSKPCWPSSRPWTRPLPSRSKPSKTRARPSPTTPTSPTSRRKNCSSRWTRRSSSSSRAT